MSAFRTPAVNKAIEELVRQFPNIRFGIYNRRKISGSTSWSQHSWPNALDIVFTSYGDTSEAHQARLDDVYEWLRNRWVHFNIRTLLWRRSRHYDHIHIDFWPKGHGTPSETRGGDDNLYQKKDGTVITQAQLVGQEEEDDMALSRGDRGHAVARLQMALKAWKPALALEVDGIYGEDTEAAVGEYQDAAQFPERFVRGVADGVTAAYILRYLLAAKVHSHTCNCEVT